LRGGGHEIAFSHGSGAGGLAGRTRLAISFHRGDSTTALGQPRLTNDIDLTILMGFGQEARYVDELLGLYNGRIPDAREFALKHRVLLLVSGEQIPIDVALGGIAFEEQVISRASRYEFLPGLLLPTCSVEDLIILKSFADRPRHWADVETIVVRQQEHLDWTYILEQLRPLCHLKEAPEIIEHLELL
jgi:hypothetical protein